MYNSSTLQQTLVHPGIGGETSKLHQKVTKPIGEKVTKRFPKCHNLLLSLCSCCLGGDFSGLGLRDLDTMVF